MLIWNSSLEPFVFMYGTYWTLCEGRPVQNLTCCYEIVEVLPLKFVFVLQLSMLSEQQSVGKQRYRVTKNALPCRKTFVSRWDVSFPFFERSEQRLHLCTIWQKTCVGPQIIRNMFSNGVSWYWYHVVKNSHPSWSLPCNLWKCQLAVWTDESGRIPVSFRCSWIINLGSCDSGRC